MIVFILLTIVIAYYKILGVDISGFILQLSDNALAISVTLFGFFLTILTILNSIETRRMKFVRDLGGFPRLLEYLKNAISSNLILVGASFLVKYIEHRKNVSYLYLRDCNIVDYLFIFIFIYTMLLSFRFTKIFVALLTDPANK